MGSLQSLLSTSVLDFNNPVEFNCDLGRFLLHPDNQQYALKIFQDYDVNKNNILDKNEFENFIGDLDKLLVDHMEKEKINIGNDIRKIQKLNFLTQVRKFCY